MEGQNMSQIRMIVLAVSLVFTGVTVAPHNAIASEKTTTKKTVKKKKKKKKAAEKTVTEEATAIPPEETPSSSKTIEILANVGLAPSPFLAAGGTIGLFLGSGDMAVEGTFMMGQAKDDPVSMASTVVTARFRKSFFGIPYVAAGLGMRSLTAKWNTLSVDETEEFPSGITSTALIAELALGAQFSLGSFLIGADLVGVMYPVSKMSKSETIPEGSYSETDYAEQKEKFEAKEGMNLILGRVGIGLAF